MSDFAIVLAFDWLVEFAIMFPYLEKRQPCELPVGDWLFFCSKQI